MKINGKGSLDKFAAVQIKVDGVMHNSAAEAIKAGLAKYVDEISMYFAILRVKFLSNPEMLKELLATGDAELVDTQDTLHGDVLTAVRDELQGA